VSVTFEKVLEEVKALTPDEQQRLWELLDTWLAPIPSPTKEDELDRLLLEKGVISRIPPPITDLTPYQNRKPIEVKGKPVSETIIKERR
jgi:hypothetical protein